MVRALDPLRAWRDNVGRQFLQLDFKPLSDAPFRARIEPLLMTEDVRVYRSTMTPGLTFRDAELVKDGDDSLALICAMGTPLEITHCGREIKLSPGQAALLHNCLPGSMGACRDYSYMAVMLPMHLLTGLNGALPSLVGRTWVKSSVSMKLLKSYISLLQNMGSAPEAVHAAAARHIVDLVRLASSSEAGSSPEINLNGVKAVQLNVALAAIAERFSDPGLSEPQIAAAAHVSTRQLQRLFEAAGIRFVEHLNEIRLASAYSKLTDPRFADWRISDIALASGFSDVSHFNRCFRRRYDATPASLRAAKCGRRD